MAAQHPERIKAIDDNKCFGFWLPGLKCTAPGAVRWQFVPYVYFRRGGRQVRLGSDSGAHSPDVLAIPAFRK